MAILSLLIGIFACLFLIPGLIPFLGFINYINVPIAIIGLIFGMIARKRTAAAGDTNYLAWIGIILNLIAIVVGIIRVLLGQALM